MSILKTLLAKGYFPKELPPGFSTQQFAGFVTQKAQSALRSRGTRSPSEPVEHKLYRASGKARALSIPNPFHYLELAEICSPKWSILLKAASGSPISSSRPIYREDQLRAVSPNALMHNLRSRRVRARASSRYLLSADVKAFYPSVYTHALAWAINPSARKPENWNNQRLLGNRIDSAVRKMQGRRSIGLPIGPDLSLLFAECLLSRVDRKLKCSINRCYRWFDDYELAFGTLEEAEQAEATLDRALKSFRLALSDEKSRIKRLPIPTNPPWKNALNEHSTRSTVDSIVGLFDLAFSWRDAFPGEPVVNYAIGKLFDFPKYKEHSGLIYDLVCQSILAEPGCVPKAVALLVHYSINGAELDLSTIKSAITLLIERGHRRDVGSDIAWCLQACKELKISLPRTTGKQLSSVDDDVVALLSMHLASTGLLSGWDKSTWAKRVTSDAVWERHWLAVYEGVLRGWLPDPCKSVSGDPHFGSLMNANVHFYDDTCPAWATVLHQSGAPGWLRHKILDAAGPKKRNEGIQTEKVTPDKTADTAVPAESSQIGEAIDDPLFIWAIAGMSEDEEYE